MNIDKLNLLHKYYSDNKELLEKYFDCKIKDIVTNINSVESIKVFFLNNKYFDFCIYENYYWYGIPNCRTSCKVDDIKRYITINNILK
jgi:hypothetical protein